MKANELMVGDLVRVKAPYFKKNKAYRVVEVREHGYNGEATANIELPDEDEEASMTGEYIIGIPLTPEILEKNGFERRDDLVERIEDPLPFIYEDKETTESVSVGWRDSYDNGLRDENAEYFEEYWKIWIDAFDARYEKTARILYVHELQHALRLCGIEKEIVL